MVVLIHWPCHRMDELCGPLEEVIMVGVTVNEALVISLIKYFILPPPHFLGFKLKH